MPRASSSNSNDELLRTLQERFEANKARHRGIEWSKVKEKLKASPKKLKSLQLMEETGGEPDVVGFDKMTGEVLFYDCSPETPKDRVSVCYDLKGLESRKEHKPKDNAMDMAEAMGVTMLTEEEYHALQKLGEFDLKTSSWLKSPDAIRKLGGALYGERRYNRVFIGHNGAQSYYAVRGFRACLRV
jgi:hypothetical protein